MSQGATLLKIGHDLVFAVQVAQVHLPSGEIKQGSVRGQADGGAIPDPYSNQRSGSQRHVRLIKIRINPVRSAPNPGLSKITKKEAIHRMANDLSVTLNSLKMVALNSSAWP